jgi:hypothetical protein
MARTELTQPKADEIKAEADDTKAQTEEARKASKETLEQQESARPYPSQEEADKLRTATASGAAPYKTRAARSE